MLDASDPEKRTMTMLVLPPCSRARLLPRQGSNSQLAQCRRCATVAPPPRCHTATATATASRHASEASLPATPAMATRPVSSKRTGGATLMEGFLMQTPRGALRSWHSRLFILTADGKLEWFG